MPKTQSPLTYTVTVSSEAELLLHERASAFIQEVRSACRNAPHGKVLDQTELAVLLAGKEFLRTTLESTLQEEAKEQEKKTVVSANKSCGIVDTSQKPSSPPQAK